MGKYLYAAVAAAVFVCSGAVSAFADPVLGPDTEGVMTRPRVEYDAKGLPLGGFRLFPKLDVSAGYDDNVIRQDTALAKGSTLLEETPRLFLQSQWSRHYLDLYADMDALQYTQRSNDSQTAFTVGGDGRLDVTRGMDVSGGGSYASLREPRNSPDQAGNALKPTPYADSNANTTLEYHPYNFAFQLGGTYERKVYGQTQLIGGGTLSNADRAGDVYGLFTKLAYEFSPGYAAFFRTDYNDRTFDSALDRNLFHRASHGYTANGGLDMMLTHLIRGEVFVGYLDQIYKGTTLKPLNSVSGLDYGANLDWYATGLLTMHLTASHSVTDTILANTSASNDQMVGLSADYELERNVIVQANVSYKDSTYSGNIRSDKYTDAGVTVSYLINRYMSADAKYTFEHRASTIAGVAYNDNIVSVGLSFHP
jgi:hypothetical protein